jgi:hypothetical protein
MGQVYDSARLGSDFVEDLPEDKASSAETGWAITRVSAQPEEAELRRSNHDRVYDRVELLPPLGS